MQRVIDLTQKLNLCIDLKKGNGKLLKTKFCVELEIGTVNTTEMKVFCQKMAFYVNDSRYGI